MAHHPFPYFRPARNAWFVEIDGHEHTLGKHPDSLPAPKKNDEGKWSPPPGIMKLYHRRMGDRGSPAAVQIAAPAGRYVAELIDDFLDKYAATKAPRTYEWYKRCLQSFRDATPELLTIGELAPSHVTDWLHGKTWSDATRHGAIHAVKKAVRWACREHKLGASPLADVTAPTPQRREAVINQQQWPHVLGASTDDEFKDLLTFLWETGARPQEARHVEARHFEPSHARIVFPACESKGKKFPRVIYLTPAAAEVVARLATKYPEGKLFRDSEGKPWTRNAIRCRFRRQRIHRRVKVKVPGLCCYAIRHSYATNALRAGVDPVTLAVLMGHADASMIATVYQHLATDPEYLRAAATRARKAS